MALLKTTILTQVEPFFSQSKSTCSGPEKGSLLKYLGSHYHQGSPVPGIDGLHEISWSPRQGKNRNYKRWVYYFFNKNTEVFLISIYGRKPKLQDAGFNKNLDRGIKNLFRFLNGRKMRNSSYAIHDVGMTDLKTLREKLGLTQKEFADNYGFVFTSLRSWEQGRTKPTNLTRILLKVIEYDPQIIDKALKIDKEI